MRYLQVGDANGKIPRAVIKINLDGFVELLESFLIFLELAGEFARLYASRPEEWAW